LYGIPAQDGSRAKSEQPNAGIAVGDVDLDPDVIYAALDLGTAHAQR